MFLLYYLSLRFFFVDIIGNKKLLQSQVDKNQIIIPLINHTGLLVKLFFERKV